MIANKTLLITGGTRGIGAQLVKQSLARGAKKVIATGRTPSSVETAKAEMNNDDLTWLVCDLAKPTDRAKLLTDLSNTPLDGVIHNAGIQVTREWPKNTTAEENTTPSVEEEMAINFVAPVELTDELLHGLAKRDDPTFVCFVTSGLALAPKKSSPVYCASKAALRSYSKSLRAQLATSAPNVQVMEALPPLVDTDMTAGRGKNKLSPEEAARQILDGIAAEKTEIYVGKSNALRWIMWLTPSLGESMVIKN